MVYAPAEFADMGMDHGALLRGSTGTGEWLKKQTQINHEIKAQKERAQGI